jgi:hypothetical protein
MHLCTGETVSSFSGFLYKRGQFVKNWKWRYFVLERDGLLNYYANKSSNSPKGRFVLVAGRTEISIPRTVKHQPTSYPFQLSTPAKTLVLCAKDNETRASWVQFLRARSKTSEMKSLLVGSVRLPRPSTRRFTIAQVKKACSADPELLAHYLQVMRQADEAYKVRIVTSATVVTSGTPLLPPPTLRSPSPPPLPPPPIDMSMVVPSAMTLTTPLPASPSSSSTSSSSLSPSSMLRRSVPCAPPSYPAPLPPNR